MKNKNSSKILVLIPTYNEFENIGLLIKEIEGLRIAGLDILVVDDGSLDGTDKFVVKLSKKYKNIFLIERGVKKGIGSAHLEGIKWAYAKNYKRLITMDGDLTHSPKYFKDLILA
ncbi:MAG: glycosyltransferase, partial [Candidatus Ratteibacteria bacterium]